MTGVGHTPFLTTRPRRAVTRTCEPRKPDGHSVAGMTARDPTVGNGGVS